MGKYTSKYKGIGEVAPMEVAHVGVRTRDRALAMAAEESTGNRKRRKVAGGELRYSPSKVQLSSDSRVVVTPENSGLPATSRSSGRRTVSTDRGSSLSSDDFPTSCCSSNASSELEKESFKIADLEDGSVQIETSTCEYFGSRERREMTPSSKLQVEAGELESTARPSEANSCLRLSVEKPSERELEEFFAAAEKDLQKRFREKYNYDIVKDVPLEGRYEWIRLKP